MMDVILYSLLKNKIANTDDEKITSVGDYGIEIVDSIPTTREANTIYFVRREVKSDDKLVLGGKGLQCIVYNDIMLGMGVLNGNVFFEGYDFLNNVERILVEATDGLLIHEFTKPLKIKGMTMTGRTLIEEEKIRKCYIDNIDGMPVRKECYTSPRGLTDVLDMDSKTLSRKVQKVTFDGALNWRVLYTVNGITTFRIVSFTTKPTFLTNGSLYNSALQLPSTETAIADSGVTVGNLSGVECTYISNSVVYLCLNTTNRGIQGNAEALKTYLTSNPITMIVEYKETQIEVLEDLPDEIIAKEEGIRCETEENAILPIIMAYLPVDKDTL
jgi:hypothetical protein